MDRLIQLIVKRLDRGYLESIKAQCEIHLCLRPEPLAVSFELADSLLVKLNNLGVQLRLKVRHYGQLQIAFEKMGQEPQVFGRKLAK